MSSRITDDVMDALTLGPGPYRKIATLSSITRIESHAGLAAAQGFLQLPVRSRAVDPGRNVFEARLLT